MAERYKDGSNGDAVAKRLASMLAKADDKLEALKKFAQANDIWRAGYSDLANFGLVRLNVGNRLRARVRKGEKIAWSA